MLSVESQGIGQRIGYIAPLIRADQGIPDGQIVGLPATLGSDGTFKLTGQYAVPGNNDFVNWINKLGYTPIDGAPTYQGLPRSYANPSIPPYAFVVTLDTLRNNHNPFTRAD